MTIFGYILAIVITLCVVSVSIYISLYFHSMDSNIGLICTIIITILLLVGTWGIGFWYYTNTESGKREVKSQQSNFDGGITREVKVYDVEGDLIKEYRGKFDVDYDNDRIIFDDENGNRHIIYYPTGTIIIDEIG